MKNISRKQFILNRLQTEGKVIITELAEELKVSSMTIRRDLTALADSGLVTLEHGGAVLNDGSMFEYSIPLKHEFMSDEKKRIAKKCMEYIAEGDSIFLDAGTTVARVAELLKTRKNLVAMTHSLLAANAAANAKHVKLIMCPGEFREHSMAFMGPLTDEFIDSFQIDILFLAVEGIDLKNGVSVIDIQDGNTKKTLVQKAKKVICIADSTKFNKSFFYRIAPLSSIDLIITDTGLDEETKKQLEKNKIPFITV